MSEQQPRNPLGGPRVVKSAKMRGVVPYILSGLFVLSAVTTIIQEDYSLTAILLIIAFFMFKLGNRNTKIYQQSQQEASENQEVK